MVMTLDTPVFDIPSHHVPPLAGFKHERSPSAGLEEFDVEWTEYEDGLLQSCLLAPSSAYPPGTLPPADALDHLSTQILTRVSRQTSLTSLSSLCSSSSISTLDTSTPMEDVLASSSSSSGSWRHSWSATRRRLFDIARLESREAVGGHRRDESEAMVPIPPQRRLQRPKLAMLGGQRMSRQQHSMDSLYGDGEQSITEAVRLSSTLQDRALRGAPTILHSNSALSSPVMFEFGAKTLPRRKPIPSSSTPNLPRPPLLQRGRSYTGEDLARESAREAHHSLMNSGDEDDFAADVDVDVDVNDTEASIVIRVPWMRRSVSSPNVLSHASRYNSSISSQAISEDTEPDPITPLHQLSFPMSVFGLGPFQPGEGTPTSGEVMSESNVSTALGLIPSMRRGRLLSLSPSTRPPLLNANPLLAHSPRKARNQSVSPSPAHELANLAISPLPLAPLFPNKKDPTATSTITSSSSLPLPLSSSGTLRCSTRHTPLNRPISGLSTSTSLPTRPSSRTPLASLSPSTSSSALSSDLEAGREVKRWVLPTTSGSGTSGPKGTKGTHGFRARLNPGLSVRVPVPTQGGLGEALSGPFEHKPVVRT